MVLKNGRIQNGNEECVNSCVCNSPPSSISMFSLCWLRTPSTRITLLTSPFLCRVSGRCGHGSPCEQLCYELHDGMYECVCKDGYILHKNGYSCAGECANRRVCVNRFDPYPALQFAFMADDIFDFRNKISRRAGPTNFLTAFLLFSKHRLLPVTGPLKIFRLIPEYSYIKSFVSRLASNTSCYCLQFDFFLFFFFITISRKYIRKC